MDTKERILVTAWRLLEVEDTPDASNAVRMSDIAKAAGISRQALYLHFPGRAELLIAVTRYIDEVKDVDARLEPSRTAATGVDRLDAFIEAWGNYIPEIYGVGRALLAMALNDTAAAAAWDDRMEAVRQGCEAAVRDLNRDGTLSEGQTPEQATDLLWTLLSVRNWEQLTQTCGWPQQRYIETVKEMAAKMLVGEWRAQGEVR